MAESDFNFDRWEPAITTDIARMMLRPVWECESNGKNEWFKIKMETK